MILVSAVVLRDRIELVRDVVEDAGHIGVTITEAVGHGRQPGIKHEYRGRVFQSRFLPKALMQFVVQDELADSVVDAIVESANAGAVGSGIVWTTPITTARHIRTGADLSSFEKEQT
jgi:nitrogen regulatory protein P-II 1